MRSSFVPTPAFIDAMRLRFVTIPDVTDVSANVSLVEGMFDSADPDTYPAASTHFGPLESDAAPTIEYDAVEEAWFIVWPDPAAGWDFVSATITDAVTITGYRVDSTGDIILGAVHVEEVTVTADGQHVVLPSVALEIFPDVIVPAAEPLSL